MDQRVFVLIIHGFPFLGRAIILEFSAYIHIDNDDVNYFQARFTRYF